MSEYEDLGNGVIYTKGFETFYSASLVSDVKINSNCKIIRGESEYSYAFRDSINTLVSFSFDANSKLETIENYAFYKCSKLQSIDLSQCSNLQTINDYAFAYCSSVTSIQFPNSLKYLRQYSLSYLTNLQTITLPASLEAFDQCCLRNSEKLQSVTFEKGIKIPSIQWRTFRSSGITRITIPASVSSVVPSAFEMTTITKIEIEEGNEVYKIINNFVATPINNPTTLVYFPSGLTEAIVPEPIAIILGSSFTNSQIETVTLPNTLTTIQSYAFAESPRLQSVTIPNSVLSIEQAAFASCTSLNSVTFEPVSQVQTLSNYVFQRCSSLESIDIPQYVTNIGSGCFMLCTSLSSITINGCLTQLGGGAFTNCSANCNIQIVDTNSLYLLDQEQHLILSKNDPVSLISFLGSETVTIPENVKTIESYAFAYNKYLTTVNFLSQNNLEKIGDFAFSECSKLQTINLPNSITEVGQSAFSSCVLITSINLPNVQLIHQKTFEYCNNLQTIPFNSLTQINEYAFRSCKSLNEFNFGESPCSIIGEYAFTDTYKLQSLTFPSELETIEPMAFVGSGIKTITFAEDSQMTQLEDSTFYQATQLSEIINFPHTITTIGEQCFAYTALTSFTVPSSTTEIGDLCFSYCSSLKSLTIPSGCQLNTIGFEICRGCSQLETITANNGKFFTENDALFNEDKTELYLFPPASPTKVLALLEGIKTIRRGAFYGCKHLHHILIPDNGKLTTIGQSAFEECSNLRVINLPKSIQTINSNAFAGCNKLKCGQLVEINEDLIPTLISAGFPRQALSMQCLNTCKDFHGSHSFLIGIFIAVIH